MNPTSTIFQGATIEKRQGGGAILWALLNNFWVKAWRIFWGLTHTGDQPLGLDVKTYSLADLWSDSDETLNINNYIFELRVRASISTLVSLSVEKIKS